MQRRIDFDGENKGTDANQADVLSGSGRRLGLVISEKFAVVLFRSDEVGGACVFLVLKRPKVHFPTTNLDARPVSSVLPLEGDTGFAAAVLQNQPVVDALGMGSGPQIARSIVECVAADVVDDIWNIIHIDAVMKSVDHPMHEDALSIHLDDDTRLTARPFDCPGNLSSEMVLERGSGRLACEMRNWSCLPDQNTSLSIQLKTLG